jgi:uncharacterized membrane protein
MTLCFWTDAVLWFSDTLFPSRLGLPGGILARLPDADLTTHPPAGEFNLSVLSGRDAGACPVGPGTERVAADVLSVEVPVQQQETPPSTGGLIVSEGCEMESRAKAAGHAVHQQLVVFPLGLLATAVVFDVIGLGADDARFASASYLMIAAGLLMGVVAAVFGLIDYLAIPRGTRARRIGFLHGVGNLVVLALFLGSWLVRAGTEGNVPEAAALVLGLAALATAAATAWLGGELVDRLGVGVDDDAGLDAPTRLTTGISLRRPHSAAP